MLVFIDDEHADSFEREHGKKMLVNRTSIKYQLADLSSTHCHLVRYDRIDQALLDKIGATAIFISGNSFAPADYTPRA
jgi:hypothetical protein